MARFLNVFVQNLLKGPSTTPFPFGETFSPDSIRGKVVMDPSLCIGCGMCNYVCATDCIKLFKKENGWTLAVWHNRCCRCGSCVAFCPMHALSFAPDWHLAHFQDAKLEQYDRIDVEKQKCPRCGKMHRMIPSDLAKKLYAKLPDVDPEEIRQLCPACRRLLDGQKQAAYVEKRLAELKATPSE